MAKTYGYSSENLLTSATGGVTLAYDPALRLYQTVSGATTTRFLYDGFNAIAEYNGSNALQRRFVFDPTTGQPVLWFEGTGTAATNRRYLGQDERSSVISVVDNAGALLGINTYDEYGKPGSANLGRYQYTGQKWIGEAGIYDYKARNYLPHVGIFAQTDPIGQRAGPNVYAYVLDDPINLTDPSGRVALVDNVAGGVFAVGVDVGIQLISTGKVDTSAQGLAILALDFGVGFATSGVSGAANLYRFSTLTRATANAGIAATGSVVQTAGKSKITGQSASPTTYAQNAALAAGLGFVGSLVANVAVGTAMLQNARNGVYLVDSAGNAFLVTDSGLTTAADILAALASSTGEITITVVDENGNEQTVKVSKKK